MAMKLCPATPPHSRPPSQKRSLLRGLAALALVLSPACWAQEPAASDEADPDWEKLKSNAQKFVEAYNAKDAAAIAALFTEDAEMEQTDGTLLQGREAIEASYLDVFEDRPEAQVALEVDSVRYLSPSVAVEDGTVFLTESADGEPASLHYTALYSRQEDGNWLIVSTRDREVVAEIANAQLDALSALLGDWVGQVNGGTMKLNNIHWDASGAFLLGEAVFFAPDIEPSRTSLRIGWDPVRKTIVAWAFDDEGGHSQGVVTKIGKDWVVRWSGYTSDGELTSSTNVISPIDELSMRWAIVNKIVGDELLPDTAVVFARQPVRPNVSAK